VHFDGRGGEISRTGGDKPFFRHVDIRKLEISRPGTIMNVTEEELTLIRKYGWTLEEIMILREPNEE